MIKTRISRKRAILVVSILPLLVLLTLHPEAFSRALGRARTVRIPAPPTLLFIDKKAKKTIPYSFHMARPFSEGLAPVLIDDQWGYIDKEGTLKIGSKFKHARAFSEGLAAVKIGKDWGYVDTKGEIVIKPNFAAAREFKNGRAIVYVRTDSKDFPVRAKESLAKILKNRTTSDLRKALLAIAGSRKGGFIDRQGKYIIKPSFTSVTEFSHGLSLVKDGETFKFVNEKGAVAFTPQAERVKTFSDGLAAVRIKEKWGYIDTTGKIVIKPAFDEAQEFHSGLAACKKGSKWGFIDKRGNWAIEPTFDSVWEGFENGVAVCGKDMCPIKNSFAEVTRFDTGFIISRRKGKEKGFDESTTPLSPGYFAYPDYRFGLVGKNGRALSKFEYGEIGSLSNGLRPARLDGRYGFIDNAGSKSIDFDYRWASPFSDGMALVKEGNTKPRSMERAETLLKHSVPSLVNDPELIVKDIEVCTKVLELDPRNVQALRDRGYFRCCLGEYEKSLPDFEKVIEICPISTEGFYWRGHSFLVLKRYPEALLDFTRALELNGSDARLYAGRAQALIGMEKYSAAYNDIIKANRADSTSRYYVSIRASILEKLGLNDKAYRDKWHGRLATNLDPWPVWPKTQADLEQEIEKKEATYKEVKKLANKRSYTYAASDLADSIDTLRRLKYREEKYLELEPLYKRAVKLREEALSSFDEEKDGVTVATIIKNDLANAYAQLASWYLKSANMKEGKRLFDKAIELAKRTNSLVKQADYLNDLAKMYMTSGRYEKSEDILKESLQLSRTETRSPAHSTALSKIVKGQTLSIYSLLLRKMDREEEADKRLKEANENLRFGTRLTFLPSPPRAKAGATARDYLELAIQSRSLSLIEQARKYADRAEELAKDDDDTRELIERFKNNDLPAVTVDLKLTKEYLIGRTAELSGDYISAEDFYLKCTELKSDFEWPYVALARINRLNGRLAKAEKLAKKAISLNDRCVKAWLELSRINQERGRDKKAKKAIAKALKIDPENQLVNLVKDTFDKEHIALEVM